MSDNQVVGSVLVLGAGIAGMQAAIDLAGSGYFVHMITHEPSIGGKMTQLDKTFPTNECAMCLLGPKMSDCQSHPNIKIHTNTTLENLVGEPGNFEAHLLQRARYIDPDVCTNCGKCEEVCPVKVPNLFNMEMEPRKAVYRMFPQAVPNTPVIEKETCRYLQSAKCGACAKVCPNQCIDYTEPDKQLVEKVGAVILAPGYELFDATLKGEYGYGTYTNVLKSLEYERLLSSTGPTKGKILRPSDNQKPKKVAFIQCVGSRDCSLGAEYCSSICCMYSTKEAIITKEHIKESEPTIFYLDMRSFGKGFDRYVETAKNMGVQYKRSMISSIKEVPGSKNLIIKYMIDGELHEEEFDMVVLAVGVRPPKVDKLLEATGIELNQYGFAKTDTFNPTASTRDGVYVAGVFQGPRDIPETVMNASAAAAVAGVTIAGGRGTLVRSKEYVAELDVKNDDPRVGVFVCRCGINIASVVDVPGVQKFSEKLPDVVHSEEFMYTCSQNTMNYIKDVIKEKNLNRVVISACSIRTHQGLFREMLKESGINPFYFEMANIRDHCSWVHKNEPEAATEKSKDLTAAAVQKVRLQDPLYLEPVPINQTGLVFGGGVSGMTAALTLAEQGLKCYLLEKTSQLGGQARNLYTTNDGKDVQAYVKDLIEQVNNNPKIEVLLNVKVEDFGGHAGHFITTITQPGPDGNEVNRLEAKLEHGVVITATGGKEYQPTEYCFGQDSRIITRVQYEKAVHEDTIGDAKQIVMIQCVGSRDENHKYCSRTCCGQSVKNALRTKKMYPEKEVYILYRDIRTYGFYETMYKEAREAGVVFIPFPDEQKPEVAVENGNIAVRVFDEASRFTIDLNPDVLVLATGIENEDTAAKLANLMKVPINADGFYMEMHAKLGPIDFPSRGLYLAGLGHGPKFIEESIYQAQGAVARSMSILSAKELMVGGVVAVVKPEKCAVCLTCVRVCPFSVPKINFDTYAAEIEAVQCQGCGTCVAECPGKAIDLMHYKDEQILAKIDGLFTEVGA